MRKLKNCGSILTAATALSACVFTAQAADVTTYEYSSQTEWFAEAVGGLTVGAELSSPWSKESGTASVVEESSLKSINMLDANVKYTAADASVGQVVFIDFRVKAAGLELEDASAVTEGEQARFALVNDGSDNLSYRAYVKESANGETNWVELVNSDLGTLAENVAYDARAAIDFRISSAPRITFYVKKDGEWRTLFKTGTSTATFYTLKSDATSVSSASFVGTGDVYALVGTNATIQPVYYRTADATGDWNAKNWSFYDEASDAIPGSSDVAVLCGGTVTLTGAVAVAELRALTATTIGGTGSLTTPSITNVAAITLAGVTVKANGNVLTITGTIKLGGAAVSAFDVGTGAVDLSENRLAFAESDPGKISVVAGTVTATALTDGAALGTTHNGTAYVRDTGVSEKKEITPTGESSDAKIAVPQEWTAKVYTDETNPKTGTKYTQAEAEAALTNGLLNANGYAGWESYALGLDPTDEDSRPVVKADVGTTAKTAISIKIANITPNLEAVESISYQLQKSTDGANWTDEGSAVTDADSIAVTPTAGAYYRVINKITLKTAN